MKNDLNDDLNDLFTSLEGQKIPGGCDQCDAYQMTDPNPEFEGVFSIKVFHDDWCPMYQKIKKPRRNR